MIDKVQELISDAQEQLNVKKPQEKPQEKSQDDAPEKPQENAQEKTEKPVSAHDLLADFMSAQTKASDLELKVKALSRVSLSKATEKELRLALRWHKEKKLAAKLSKELEERLK